MNSKHHGPVLFACLSAVLIALTWATYSIENLPSYPPAEVHVQTPPAPMQPAATPVSPVAPITSATPDDPCPDEANTAVFEKLFPLLGKYGEITTDKGVETYRQRLECIAEWARDLKDQCQRDTYLSWVQFYSNKIVQRATDLAGGKTENKEDDWDKRQRELKRKVRIYEAAHPVPLPPLCERFPTKEKEKAR